MFFFRAIVVFWSWLSLGCDLIAVPVATATTRVNPSACWRTRREATSPAFTALGRRIARASTACGWSPRRTTPATTSSSTPAHQSQARRRSRWPLPACRWIALRVTWKCTTVYRPPSWRHATLRGFISSGRSVVPACHALSRPGSATWSSGSAVAWAMRLLTALRPSSPSPSVPTTARPTAHASWRHVGRSVSASRGGLGPCVTPSPARRTVALWKGEVNVIRWVGSAVSSGVQLLAQLLSNLQNLLSFRLYSICGIGRLTQLHHFPPISVWSVPEPAWHF